MINAESWRYFALDLAGYLLEERLMTLSQIDDVWKSMGRNLPLLKEE
jgi:hypothetical protein